jgi:hypothetical protein
MVNPIAAGSGVSAAASSTTSLPSVSVAELLGAPTNDAAVTGLSDNAFRIRLEKHIDDVHHGQGALSSNVEGELSGRDNAASLFLGSINPKADALYQAYQTGFSYAQRARFVSGVSQASKAIAAIPKGK